LRDERRKAETFIEGRCLSGRSWSDVIVRIGSAPGSSLSFRSRWRSSTGLRRGGAEAGDRFGARERLLFAGRGVAQLDRAGGELGFAEEGEPGAGQLIGIGVERLAGSTTGIDGGDAAASQLLRQVEGRRGRL
jgi:hypothetical protein